MTHSQEPEEPNPELSMAMRAMGEGDRTFEGKMARNELVGRIDAFLTKLTDAKDRGDMVRVGNFDFPISDEAVIKQTNLGQTAIGLRSVVEETYPGIHVAGDGVFEPRRMQAVLPIDGKVSTLEVVGPDPMLPPLQDQNFREGSSQHNYGKIRIKGTTAAMDAITDHELTFTIEGDGNVRGPIREWQGKPLLDFNERGLANTIAGMGALDGIAGLMEIVPRQQ